MAGDAKQQLLDRALAHVRENGLGNASLRELATALGTSHRMLIYHFGSRDGLVAELVRATEEEERAATAAAVAELGPDADPVALLRRSWKRMMDPAVAPHQRLFFEIYAHGVSGPGPATPEVKALIDDWLRSVPAAQRDLTRLSLAVIRGLLMDVLATGDRRSANRVFEQYLALVGGAAKPAGAAKPPARRRP